MRGEAVAPADFSTGMAKSLVREIAGLLDALAKTGETAVVDLRSLPMTDTDREELEDALGRGDVAIALDVAGHSEIWETGYAGVWWVRHYGGDDRIAAERIEITAVPEIIVTHGADIAAAAARLRDNLSVDV
jgi:hydrogenase-1 operon protein HyaF